jgi:hypothetical protein
MWQAGLEAIPGALGLKIVVIEDHAATSRTFATCSVGRANQHFENKCNLPEPKMAPQIEQQLRLEAPISRAPLRGDAKQASGANYVWLERSPKIHPSPGSGVQSGSVENLGAVAGTDSAPRTCDCDSGSFSQTVLGPGNREKFSLRTAYSAQ